MQHLFYLNKYFFKYRKRLLLGILFIFVSNFFQSLQPQMIRQALDLVVENIAMYHMYDGFELQTDVFNHLGKTLLYFGVVVFILALLMGSFLFLVRQTIIVMSRLVEFDLRTEIFQHYEDLHLAFYKKNSTGDLMARVMEDVSKVRMYLGPAILYGINLVSLFTLVIISMLRVNVTLTLWSLLPLPILSISIYYVSSLISKNSEKIQRQLSKLTSISQEVYSGIRVVKSYVQEAPMGRFFHNESQRYMDKSLKLARVDALFQPTMLVLIGLSTIITVYVGGVQVSKGNITTGNIAEFIIYVNMLTWPVTSLGWISSLIQQAAASQKRINEFLEIKPEIVSPVGSGQSSSTVNKSSAQLVSSPHHTSYLIPHTSSAIVFDNVSFTYPDTGIVALRNISFELQPGQKLAIIGRTGSGKSTIADLLVRLYDVTEGAILVEGVDIRQHDLSRLRQRIGYVPQDVFLFSDSVSNNVRFGRPDASQEMVETFTKHAAIYDEIAELPEGFETVVGERGVTLSGGQKQRVSIARALVKQPDIVLLDDCLSAVDTNTEKQILSYLGGDIADKTAIIITHRIYSLLEFDKIIVLGDGRILEEGTHLELLQNRGYYWEQYEKQRVEEVDN
ncbi:MAG: ABC transporter ATP-binding protein/permease [Saprospiraceae bacterium]|nr:ABC transporter ATP-binding protein/permease [Saprospiraceae bacterium]MCF8250681.1 ABC transporter ATP-binding protein/permease [Saprospiraceae bacterium]MCF8282745.1 ABC transporter ATP-binding protein/permease [Bacteroidales bacterium]MCF8312533.1 ABC transporter ATP-binding protein/permease [Saprospiraceae bacterium]MCF8440787.1 ABC transporter ATP-binding protein/permease [Saprospiraceae bacterium]